MGGKKLFTPEDFDKEQKISQNPGKKGSSTPTFAKKPFVSIVIVGCIAIACVIGYLLLHHPSVNEIGNGNMMAGPSSTEQTDSTKIEAEPVDVNKPDTSSTTNNEQPEVVESDADATEAQETVVPDPTTPGITSGGSVEEEATLVIRGVYGNGEERKQKLGAKYPEIQNKVNEMYRDGLVD